MFDASLSGVIACVAAGSRVRAEVASVLVHQPLRLIEIEDSLHLLQVLKHQHVDCVLLEVQFGRENGLFVQQEMRQFLTDAPPVVFMGTARDDRLQIAKIFRTGGTDYIDSDDLQPGELLRALGFAIRRRRQDVSNCAELEVVRQRSDFDELTGLYSRRALAEVGQRFTSVSSQKPFALLLIRNRQYEFGVNLAGASFGKQLMRSLASRLRGLMRQTDVIGRFDDRTIMALLPLAQGAGTKPMLDRLNQTLPFPFHTDDLSLNVSVAISAAVYPEHGADIDTLVQFAQAALDGQTVIDGYGSTPAVSPNDTTREPRCGDRRAHPRHRVLKRGKIIVTEAETVIDCSIRDVSDGGVRLRLPGVLPMPSRFDLVIVGEGASRQVRRAWQQGLEVGVAFLVRQAASLGGAAADPSSAAEARAELLGHPRPPREESQPD